MILLAAFPLYKVWPPDQGVLLMLVAVQTIDLHSLLLAIHGFFESLGVDEIRRRCQADDKPLRMVKTILHELCKLKGTEIYRYAWRTAPAHACSVRLCCKSVWPCHVASIALLPTPCWCVHSAKASGVLAANISLLIAQDSRADAVVLSAGTPRTFLSTAQRQAQTASQSSSPTSTSTSRRSRAMGRYAAVYQQHPAHTGRQEQQVQACPVTPASRRAGQA
jgi:hypothetical protein